MEGRTRAYVSFAGECTIKKDTKDQYFATDTGKDTKRTKERKILEESL